MGPEHTSDGSRPGAGDLLNKLRSRSEAAAGGPGRPGRPGKTGRPDQPGQPGRPRPPGSGAGTPGPAHVASPAGLGLRLAVAGALTVVAAVVAVAGASSVVGPWIGLAVAAACVGWCGWPLHRAAVAGLASRRLGTDLLASAGAVVTLVLAVVEVSRAASRGGAALDVVTPAAVTTLLLLGRHLEHRAAAALQAPARALLQLGARDVAVLRIDPRHRATAETRVSPDELAVGDHFIVHPGEPVAADGRVVEGSSTVDPGPVTGGPASDVAPGDAVTSGAVNRGGRLVVEAARVGRSGLLATAQRVVRAAVAGPAPTHPLAGRLATWAVPFTLVLATALGVVWFVVADAPTALRVLAAVLVVASPAALVLATARAWLAGIVAGLRGGTLLARPGATAAAGSVDTLVVAGSGTVTTGAVELRSIAVVGRLSKKAALTAAAAVAQGSDDSVARALVDGADLARIELPRITDFQSTRGEGASARIKDTEVTVGEASLFETVDPDLLAHADANAGTTVFVGWAGAARAALTVTAAIRKSAGDDVARLRELRLVPHLAIPATQPLARHVAVQSGIEPGNAHGLGAPGPARAAAPAPSRGGSPGQARGAEPAAPAGSARSVVADVVADLRRQGHVVAVVATEPADGPALAAADLAVATRADDAHGLPLAEGADLVTLRPGLGQAAGAIELARATEATVRENAAVTVGYHALALPLAALGVIHPILAAALSGAALLVPVVNGLRLARDR